MKLQITGTHINYLFICRRKLWLYSRNLQMESHSDSVAIGRHLHEKSFSRQKKELLIDGVVRLDFYEDGVIHEVKKSNSMEKAHIAQLLFYMLFMKKKGVIAKGQINYPKQKKILHIELTADKEKEVEEHIAEAKKIIKLPEAPFIPEPMKLCSKCSYNDLCWA